MKIEISETYASRLTDHTPVEPGSKEYARNGVAFRIYDVYDNGVIRYTSPLYFISGYGAGINDYDHLWNNPGDERARAFRILFTLTAAAAAGENDGGTYNKIAEAMGAIRFENLTAEDYREIENLLKASMGPHLERCGNI